MFPFLFLSLIIRLTQSVTYSFSTAIIDVEPLETSAAINKIVPQDQCNKIIARQGGLYHLSKEGIYQSWAKGLLGSQRSTFTALNAVDLDVNSD